MDEREVAKYRLAFKISFDAIRRRKGVNKMLVERLELDCEDVIKMAESPLSKRSTKLELDRLLFEVRYVTKFGGEDGCQHSQKK